MPKKAQTKSNRYAFARVKFVNLVVSALGIFYMDSKALISVFEDFKITTTSISHSAKVCIFTSILSPLVRVGRGLFALVAALFGSRGDLTLRILFSPQIQRSRELSGVRCLLGVLSRGLG